MLTQLAARLGVGISPPRGSPAQRGPPERLWTSAVGVPPYDATADAVLRLARRVRQPSRSASAASRRPPSKAAAAPSKAAATVAPSKAAATVAPSKAAATIAAAAAVAVAEPAAAAVEDAAAAEGGGAGGSSLAVYCCRCGAVLDDEAFSPSCCFSPHVPPPLRIVPRSPLPAGGRDRSARLDVRFAIHRD